MSAQPSVPSSLRSPRPLLILLWVLLCQAPTVAQAGAVRLHWPTPEPAERLTRPILLRVDDARPRGRGDVVGAGREPASPDAPAGERPAKESWILSSSAAFERSLGAAVEGALRGKGVWAGRTEMLDAPAQLLVQVRRFWCEDPGTPEQACEAEARLRMGVGLLPDVTVHVGPGEDEPFDALAGQLVERLAEVIAALQWAAPAGLRTTERAFVRSPEGGWLQVTAASEGALCVWADGRGRPVPSAEVEAHVEARMPERGSVGWVSGASRDALPQPVLAPFAGDLFSLQPDTLSLHRLPPGATWDTYAPLALHGQPCPEPVADADHARPASTDRAGGPFAGLSNPEADEVLDFEVGGRRSRALGRGVLAARVEIERRRDERVVVVLVQLDPRWGEVDMMLRYNPPGASWLNEPLVHVGDGRFQARVTVERKGSTYLFCTVRARGLVPSPALASASELLRLR